VVSSFNALGQITEFFYDAVGRRVAVETPLGYRSTTVYNLAGQVVSSIDALGNNTTYAYDDAGNQIRVTNPLGYSITSIYASNSNLLSAVQNQIGYLTTYTYDLNGRQVSRKTRNSSVVTWVYDNAGQNTVITNELGRHFTTS